MRGTPPDQVFQAQIARFIPACAGNTTRPGLSGANSPVHPRLCGEHAKGTAPMNYDDGFIPACAGNTGAMVVRTTTPTVHPRLCGEHNQSQHFSGAAHGSSPPVRGTQDDAGIEPRYTRFIPACAGNTCHGNGRRRRYPVHPRLCGEHSHRDTSSSLFDGSSPPVRGTLYRQDGIVRMIRFIPACAGNTVENLCGMRTGAVHPRLCGEHRVGESKQVTCIGSSPPVRGTLLRAAGRARILRFIPACAGNTCSPPLC